MVFLFARYQHATKEQKANGKVVFDGIIEMAKENLAQGVPVGLGTDTACPFVTQYDMWRELDFYGKYCGVSNAFALYTGTLLNATLAGVGDVTGPIEVGKCADMIVTKGNPLGGSFCSASCRDGSKRWRYLRPSAGQEDPGSGS